MIGSDDASEILARLEVCGIEVWVDGGWGVNALLGEQTRAHDDLDLVIARCCCCSAARDGLVPPVRCLTPTCKSAITSATSQTPPITTTCTSSLSASSSNCHRPTTNCDLQRLVGAVLAALFGGSGSVASSRKQIVDWDSG